MQTSIYLWLGKGAQGQWLKGRAQALTRLDLQQQLRQQRIRVCGVMALPLAHTFWPRHQKIKATDITQLTRQLATLLEAGLALLQALRLMHQGLTPSAHSHLLQSLSDHIEAGLSLHQAMRLHSAFDPTYCHLVAAGEASGQLDRILQRLATHREKSEALQRRLRSAMTYPLIVVVVGLVVSTLLLGFVVPAFAQMFASMDAELPPLTQLVLGLSDAVTQHGPVLLVAGIACTYGTRYFLRQTSRGQRLWDWLRLRVPVWQTITLHAQSARWCRTLATLLDAGIPIHEALHQLIEVMDHRRYRAATQTIQAQLTHGHSLTQSLAQFPALFEAVLIQMCAVGEESGTLEAMLTRMADHYEQSVDALTERMSTLLEPAIMVILGLTMGTLVLAMYWPIFQIGNVL